MAPGRSVPARHRAAGARTALGRRYGIALAVNAQYIHEHERWTGCWLQLSSDAIVKPVRACEAERLTEPRPDRGARSG